MYPCPPSRFRFLNMPLEVLNIVVSPLRYFAVQMSVIHIPCDCVAPEAGDVLSPGDIGVSVSVPWVVSLVIDKPAPHCTTRRHPNIANLVSVYVIIQ